MIRKTARIFLAFPFVITQGIAGALAEFCLWVGHVASTADTRGNSLPRAMAPFFFPALYISTLTTAVTTTVLLAAEAQGTTTATEAIEEGVTLAPGLLAAAILGAFFLTPLLYYGTGGVAMIGNFLKRMEEKSRNPEHVVKLREARQEIAEKDVALAKKDEALADKDKLIERQRQEIRELKERLGITGEEC